MKSRSDCSSFKVVFFLLLFFFPVALIKAQEETFRGKITTKFYKKDNHISKGGMARMLSKGKELDISEFDTLYRSYYICADTVVMYLNGVNNVFQAKEIQIDKDNYIYDDKYFEYLKVPVIPLPLARIEPKDWKRYKRRKSDTDPFDFNYRVVLPSNQKNSYLAEVDESIQYPTQLALKGKFSYLFHPLGKMNTLVNRNDTTEYITLIEYEIDPRQDCLEHFYDFRYREPNGDVNDLFKDKTVAGLIPEKERKPFEAENLQDTAVYLTPSLADLAGKYVYVDLWASWCAPCKGEMPFMQKLKERYADADFALLSISMDKEEDRRKWQKAMAALNMNWTNWIIYDGLRSKFADRYEVQAIPHYLLLDKQGRVMNANAPRPSDVRSTELLDSILK